MWLVSHPWTPIYQWMWWIDAIDAGAGNLRAQIQIRTRADIWNEGEVFWEKAQHNLNIKSLVLSNWKPTLLIKESHLIPYFHLLLTWIILLPLLGLTAQNTQSPTWEHCWSCVKVFCVVTGSDGSRDDFDELASDWRIAVLPVSTASHPWPAIQSRYLSLERPHSHLRTYRWDVITPQSLFSQHLFSVSEPSSLN